MNENEMKRVGAEEAMRE